MIPDGTTPKVVVRDRADAGWTSGLEYFATGPETQRKVDYVGTAPVTLWYYPPGLWTGIALGDVAWLALVAFAAFAKRTGSRTRSV